MRGLQTADFSARSGIQVGVVVRPPGISVQNPDQLDRPGEAPSPVMVTVMVMVMAIPEKISALRRVYCSVIQQPVSNVRSANKP